MRQQIFDGLFQAMADDERLFLVTADMGINLVERFADTWPDRFVNVGIAEQNLVGIAAGLCNTGYRPFIYTISNFLIHRCFEQIRNDLVLHQYPVVLLGTSTGYDNAPLGPTHHVIDDWGCLKGLRAIDIYCPANAAYAESLVPRLAHATRPAYVRIAKGNFSEPHAMDDLQLIQGNDRRVLLIAYGALVQNACAAQRQDPDLSVLVIQRLHPLDRVALSDILTSYDELICVEDHFPDSGMYGEICRLIGERGLSCSVRSLGPTGYDLTTGRSADYYHRKHATSVAGIMCRVAEAESVRR